MQSCDAYQSAEGTDGELADYQCWRLRGGSQAAGPGLSSEPNPRLIVKAWISFLDMISARPQGSCSSLSWDDTEILFPGHIQLCFILALEEERKDGGERVGERTPNTLCSEFLQVSPTSNQAI